MTIQNYNSIKGSLFESSKSKMNSFRLGEKSNASNNPTFGSKNEMNYENSFKHQETLLTKQINVRKQVELKTSNPVLTTNNDLLNQHKVDQIEYVNNPDFNMNEYP